MRLMQTTGYIILQKILVYELEKIQKLNVHPNYYYTDKNIVIGVESRQFNSKIDLATKLPHTEHVL